MVGLGPSLWTPSKSSYSMISRQHHFFHSGILQIKQLHTAVSITCENMQNPVLQNKGGCLKVTFTMSLLKSIMIDYPFDKSGLEWHHIENFPNFQDVILLCLLVLSCLMSPEVHTYCETNF